MGKQKTHYDLDAVKARVAAGGMVAFTRTAKDSARQMGLDAQAALGVVFGLQRGMLFKSMATALSGRTCITRLVRGQIAYIKVTVQAGATVIQFKEK